MVLVEYPSKEHFLEMIKNPAYPSHLRTAALQDSRLIAMLPGQKWESAGGH
ncbi:MAG: hypothetical protein HC913_11590 [Microscillaceae bacterium]|nr:hypothetical protein [Microscillaceae bacterium]